MSSQTYNDITRRHYSEDLDLNLRRRENFKFLLKKCVTSLK